MGKYLDLIAASESVRHDSGDRDIRFAESDAREFDARIIEVTMRPAATTTPEPARAPTFPPCPVCGCVRYWISHGKVMCGSRVCNSAVRFELLKIEFHQVN